MEQNNRKIIPNQAEIYSKEEMIEVVKSNYIDSFDAKSLAKINGKFYVTYNNEQIPVEKYKEIVENEWKRENQKDNDSFMRGDFN